MDKAVIKLSLGEYRAPTQQELNDGKAYVKRRNEVALALTSLIEGILLDILEEIFRLCYNSNTKGEDFKIDGDDAVFEKISELMDEACDEILEQSVLRTRAVHICLSSISFLSDGTK